MSRFKEHLTAQLHFWFLLSSAGLAGLYGAAMILGDRITYDIGRFSLALFLTSIAVSLACVLLAGALIRFSGRHPVFYRRVMGVLFILLIAGNLRHTEHILRNDCHEGSTYMIHQNDGTVTQVSRASVIRDVYAQAPLFAVPTVDSADYAPHSSQALALWRWRNDATLPFFAHHCGLWIFLLYGLLLVCWFGCTAAGWKQITGWNRLLYASCILPAALPLICPVLDSLGFMHYIAGVPFWQEDYFLLVLPEVIRTGVLFGLLWESRPLRTPEEPALPEPVTEESEEPQPEPISTQT